MEMATQNKRPKWEEEAWTVTWASNKACQTCILAHGTYGEPPEKLNPDKCYCQIYTWEFNEYKPNDVAFHGAPCEYYVEE